MMKSARQFLNTAFLASASFLATTVQSVQAQAAVAQFMDQTKNALRAEVTPSSLLQTYKRSTNDDIVRVSKKDKPRHNAYNRFTYGVLNYMDQRLYKQHKAVGQLKLSEFMQLTQEAFENSYAENKLLIKRYGVTPQLVIDRGYKDIRVKVGSEDVTQTKEFKSMLNKNSSMGLNVFVGYYKPGTKFQKDQIINDAGTSDSAHTIMPKTTIAELVSPSIMDGDMSSPVNAVVLKQKAKAKAKAKALTR